MEKKETYFDKIQTKGRPKLILNEVGKELILDLAQYQCTDEEIASTLGVTIETLQTPQNIDTFLELKKIGQNKGNASIRRVQYEVAMSGNPTMLIWWGRNYLGQKEAIEQKNDEEMKEQLREITDTMLKIREKEDGRD